MFRLYIRDLFAHYQHFINKKKTKVKKMFYICEKFHKIRS